MKNKIIIGIAIFSLFLLLCTVVYAEETSAKQTQQTQQISQTTQGVFTKIGTSMKSFDIVKFYEKNPKVIDFVLFTLLFFALAYLGVSKAFYNMPAANTVAFIIALMLSLALVTAGISLRFLLPFAKGMLFIAAVVIFYFIFASFNMNKVLAFVIALAVAAVLFLFVFNMNPLTKLTFSNPVLGFRVSSSSNIQATNVDRSAGPTVQKTQTTPPVQKQTATQQQQTQKKSGTSGWAIAGIVIAAVLTGTGTTIGVVKRKKIAEWIGKSKKKRDELRKKIMEIDDEIKNDKLEEAEKNTKGAVEEAEKMAKESEKQIADFKGSEDFKIMTKDEINKVTEEELKNVAEEEGKK